MADLTSPIAVPLLPVVPHQRSGPAAGVTALAGLRYAEVETSRYCNRKCSWCPNGHTEARETQQLMPWETFTKVTAELGAAKFAGFFAFHNYNEPLGNSRLAQEIRQVQADIPGAKPAIYTNGDLLDHNVLQKMITDGVRYLRVTRYPVRAETLPTMDALRHYLRQKKLIADAYAWQFGEVRQGLAATWTDPRSGIHVEIIRPNVSTYNDCGGTAKVLQVGARRTAPCRMTETSLSVNYRGEVKMCCNVVPEDGQHQEYVVGNLADQSLAELISSPKMVDWRRRHANSDWSASPACLTCVQALPETRQ